MIDPIQLFTAQPTTPASPSKDVDAERVFAMILAKEVRKAIPEGALGGEAFEAFGPMLDELLADQIAGGLSVDVGAGGQARELPRPVNLPRRRVGRVTSAYGMRSHPIEGRQMKHDGVDLSAARGTPIRPARAGEVVFAGERGGYGNVVIVDHGGGLTTRYAHCDQLLVSKGQRVRAGQAVGTVGSTGRSTGPHLHFEVRVNDQAVDPQLPGLGDLMPRL